MATYTPNYNLYKPAGTDQFDNFLTEFGNNMDIIDSNLGGGGGSSTLGGLSDVNLTSPITNDALIYDGAEWANSPLSAVAFSGDYADLLNAPTVPTKTSDLNNDSDFVSDASYVHTDNNFTNADVTKLSGIQAGAEVNVQSDWNEADNTADDYIKNKPTIPTKTSDLNNDSGYVTDLDLMDKVDKSGDTMSGNLSIENEGNESVLTLGTNQPALTPQASSGRIDLWTAPLNTAYKTSLSPSGNTANRNIYFPDESGTSALKENKGVYVTSVEATGTSQTSSLSSYVGHMAMVRVRVDDNNYYNLTGVDVIGQSSFVTMHGFGGNSSYTEISAVVRFSSSGHKYNCLRVMRSGTDVTSNAKLIVYVL